MLTNSEIENIIKVINCLENRGILLKGTKKKIAQKGEFLNFPGSLMRTVLPLIKNIRAPLGKNVMVLLGLTEAASTTDAAIQKKTFGSGMTFL